MSKMILILVALLPIAVAAQTKKLQAVSSTPTGCESLLREDDLRLWSCAGLKVLVLRGSPERQAEAHGKLVGRQLSAETLDFFADSPLLAVKDRPVLRFFAETALHLWTRLMDRGAPDAYFRELEAYAKGAGIPLMRARRALVAPDTAVYAWSMLEKPFFRAPGFACTSGMWTDGKGRTVVGRNLDFGGVGAFDKNPLLVVSLPGPEAKGELRHLIFGSDGLPFGGITGINEAGLSFAIHQNYTRDAVTGGVPMPYIGELVLRRARTLEEATQLIKDHRPGPLWTFVLVETATGRARAIEASKKHFVIRDGADSVFAQTNHSHDIETRSDELIDIGTKRNSEFRYDLVRRVLAGTDASAFERMARALAHQADPTGELSIHDDVIKPLTIQTYLAERSLDGKTKVHLSFDPAPTASGRFAGFELETLWGALGAETLIAQVSSPSGTPTERRVRQEEGARAFAASERPEGALEALRELASQTAPGALLARSVLALQSKQPNLALELVAQARSGSFSALPLYLRQAFDWVELSALVNEKDLTKAQARAKEILARGQLLDPGLAYLANQLVAERRLSSGTTDIGFDFFSGYIAGRPVPPEDWSRLSLPAR